MLCSIEASDEYGLQGLANANDLAQWLNSWLADPDSTNCVITKVSGVNVEPFIPQTYQLVIK